MAPECIQSQSYSEKTDIWAYGCTFVEMLTGKLPYTYCFDSDSLADLALAIRDEGLNPLGDIKHLENENKIKPPTWLVSVLELCFEQNPADRPSFAELCALIQEKNPLLSVRFQNEAEDSKRLVSEPSALPEHLRATLNTVQDAQLLFQQF
jgi:serine/threonine protein kinase